MPEQIFDVRWPDGKLQSYYSPSTAIHAHLSVGASYTLADFLERARVAMHAASERVRAKYGYTCSSAMDTLRQIELTGAQYEATGESHVVIEKIRGGK